MGCLTCLKVWLVLMDVVYGLTGAVVLALGIVWFFKNQILNAIGFDPTESNALFNGLPGDVTYYLQIIAIVFLVVGSVIIVTSILACVSVGTMNCAMFALFLIPLCLVMLLNFAIGALIVIEAKPYISDERTFKANLESALQSDNYFVNGTYTTMGEAWNILQTSNISTNVGNGGCCGVNGPTDYQSSMFQTNNKGYQVPVSCCAQSVPGTNSDPQPNEAKNYTVCNIDAVSNVNDPQQNLNMQGCINDSIYNVIYEAIVIGLSIFFAWGGWEFFIFILGIIICCYGRREEKYV